MGELEDALEEEVEEQMAEHILVVHVLGIYKEYDAPVNRSKDEDDKDEEEIFFTAPEGYNDKSEVFLDAMSSFGEEEEFLDEQDSGKELKCQEELYDEFHEFQKKILIWSAGNKTLIANMEYIHEEYLEVIENLL